MTRKPKQLILLCSFFAASSYKYITNHSTIKKKKLLIIKLNNVTLIAALLVILLSACSKNGSETPQTKCTSVTGLKATVPATVIEKGQPLTFSASITSGLTYTWKTPAGATLTTASGGVQSADFADEGWYYLEAKNTCNETAKDSVFVDVTVP